MKRALVLLSGGLDSILAIKLMQEQGVEVTAITFKTPFFDAERAKKVTRAFNLPHQVFDITAEHLEIVKDPRHGYGKNMNPCIDCHTLMIKKAGEYAMRNGYGFIVTGEVLGERPMSQNKQSLKIVERQSGFEGYVLRPLSAQHLEITIPEEKGWVDRGKLLDIKGKSRKPQMALANKYHIKDYPTPAGGCLLTDPGFSRRLKKLLEITDRPTLYDLYILKYGRHFIFDRTRFIVARTGDENEQILFLKKPRDILFKVKSHPGPRGILRGEASEDTVKKAAIITARYSQAREKEKVTVVFGQKEEAPDEITVKNPLKTYEELGLSGFQI